MRALKFNVNAQQIHKDPDCGFSNIVAGTKNYLKAHFTFSPEWQDCILVARFWRGGKEYAALIQDGISGSTMTNNGSANAFSNTQYKNIPKDCDYITL